MFSGYDRCRMRRLHGSSLDLTPPWLRRSRAAGSGPWPAIPTAVSAWMGGGLQNIGWRILRSVVSVGLIAGILASCLSLPNIDHATVALLLVAATGGLAMLWGWVEALAGAV